MKLMILRLALIGASLWTLWACYPQPETETATEQASGVSDTEIRIGSSLALGGHAGYLGTQTLNGAMSFIHHINEEGGIHGRKIRVMAVDDGYDPSRCLVNTQNFILEDRVFSLFCYVGTPTTVKIIPLVEKAKIPLVGMFTGAHALREPLSRYLINIRASYYQEIDAAVKRMVDDLHIRKVAVFYQYDDYGFDGLKGTELALRKYDLVPVARGTYIRGTTNVDEGLSRIVQSGAEAVVMIGTYEPCARFIRKAKEQGYHPLFCNVSFVGPDELARRLGEAGEGVIVTQVVPPPELPQSQNLLWGAAEYTELLKRYFPSDEPNFVGLEGYLNARVLVEGLRRAGRRLTREGFIEAIESIQNYDLGIANTLSFSPADHQGLERVYFTRIESGRFTLITDWQKIREEISVPGLTTDSISFGSSMALSGPGGGTGTRILHGAMSFLHHINEQGGIHGRRIQVLSYDHGSEPSRCIGNTQRLIHEDRVFGLFSYMHAAQSPAIVPMVEGAAIPLLGVFSGIKTLREPFCRYILNVRASFHQETAAAVDYLVKNLELKKIAVFYQEDGFGPDGLEGSALALQKHGLSPAAQAGYRREAAGVEEAVTRIMAAAPEAVILVGVSDRCADFIRLCRGREFRPVFHGVSVVGAEELAENLGKEGEGVIVTQVVPPPEEQILLPAARDYARMLEKFYPGEAPTIPGFEGFINAKILVEGMRRSGRHITREKFIDAVESMERYFVGIGAEVKFGPKDHQGLDQVYFTQIQNGKPVLIADFRQMRKCN